MKNQILKRFGIIIGITLITGLFVVPPQYLENILGPENSLVQKLKSNKISLGLDLAGGTELDYKIDLSDAIAKNNDQDELNNVNLNTIAESVRDSLEARVNPAGVGEVIVKRSQINNEEHILIQLPPSSNVAKAKADAEKDNKLEFFEEDPTLEKKARVKIAGHLTQLTTENWDQKTTELIKDKDITLDKIDFLYKDQVLNEDLAKKLFTANKGDIIQKIFDIQTEAQYNFTEDGQINITSYPQNIIGIVKVTDSKQSDREKTTEALATARHILFAYPDAMRAINLNGYESTETALNTSQEIVNNPTTIAEEEREQKVAEAKALIKEIESFPYQTKELAQAKAEAILIELKNGSNFAELAKEHSTGPSGVEGGSLGEFKPGTMAPEFNNAVFGEDNKSEKTGLVQNLVETDFGFHIIDVEKISAQKTETKLEPQIKYEVLGWNKNNMNWLPTPLGGSQLDNASVGYDQLGAPVVNLRFNKEGGALFAQLTEKVAARSQNKECNNSLCRLGIKVGGNFITTPTVQEKIMGRDSQISGNFTFESAKDLADGLNLGAIDAPVSLSGQTTIQAELGQEQLSKSLKAGAYGLLATMIFMILIYRLAGLIACASLSLYIAIFITILKTWPESFGGPIVLTLAGAAGIALSVGLAVDGNILIFERMKEELRKGRNMNKALDLGFERAWSAIRDSNLTTLLTCIILFSLGSSIIKGFAITLIVGTCLSMFTAITISRNLLRFVLLFPVFQKPVLFGVPNSQAKNPKKSSGTKIRKRKK